MSLNIRTSSINSISQYTSKLCLATAITAAFLLVGCNSTKKSQSSDINDPAVTGYEIYDTNASAGTAISNTATGSTYEYTIQPGDSLWVIARRHNTTVTYIKQLNNLEDDMIRAGDKLILPEITVSSQPAAVAQPVTPTN